MPRHEVGQTPAIYEVVAKNYGADHANRIHSDEGAAKYGFAGALVPGVGLYAYLTRPALDILGPDWLDRGAMSAKFIKPVFDGERVQAKATIFNLDPLELKLELINASGEVCATGFASLPDAPPALDLTHYPLQAPPPPEERRPAAISSFRVGEPFGSLEFPLDLRGEGPRFLDNVLETSPRYTGVNAVCHPAYLIAQANETLMRNVALGSWIHTASETRHCGLAREGAKLSLRGRVADLYSRRGHEFIVLDLAFFADQGRPIAQVKHMAIIRLRGEETVGEGASRPG
jgi:hypothetical protein